VALSGGSLAAFVALGGIALILVVFGVRDCAAAAGSVAGAVQQPFRRAALPSIAEPIPEPVSRPTPDCSSARPGGDARLCRYEDTVSVGPRVESPE